MALVEFTNNQAPYINAENLNNNFNELNGNVETGTWTPRLENCTYTATTNVGKYIKLKNCVIVYFHIRPQITAVTGPAIIKGLPYAPVWPQATGNLSVCMVTDTSYVPNVQVSNENGGMIELMDNIDGSQGVNWKTTPNEGYWLIGNAIYFIE